MAEAGLYRDPVLGVSPPLNEEDGCHMMGPLPLYIPFMCSGGSERCTRKCRPSFGASFFVFFKKKPLDRRGARPLTVWISSGWCSNCLWPALVLLGFFGIMLQYLKSESLSTFSWHFSRSFRWMFNLVQRSCRRPFDSCTLSQDSCWGGSCGNVCCVVYSVGLPF